MTNGDRGMTRSIIAATTAAALIVCVSDHAIAQTRAKADLTCQPGGNALEYDCVIKLFNARTSEPLSGVALSVGADMPSMPGAHAVRPVKAVEDAEKGTYRARVVLEMHGDWAVRLDLSGVVRDRVISVLRFEPDRVEAAQPSTPNPHRGRK